METIKGIHSETKQSYGSSRMQFKLIELGHNISLGQVERLMKQKVLAVKPGKRNKHCYEHRKVTEVSENL